MVRHELQVVGVSLQPNRSRTISHVVQCSFYETCLIRISRHKDADAVPVRPETSGCVSDRPGLKLLPRPAPAWILCQFQARDGSFP